MRKNHKSFRSRYYWSRGLVGVFLALAGLYFLITQQRGIIAIVIFTVGILSATYFFWESSKDANEKKQD